MQRKVLSRLAKEDLDKIISYSTQRFGIDQTLVLNASLERSITLLIANPELGHLRRELTPEGRILRFHTVMDRYHIIYRPDVEPIEVARILHGAPGSRRIFD